MYFLAILGQIWKNLRFLVNFFADFGLFQQFYA